MHDELRMLVRAGLTPLEALQCATLNPAQFLDEAGSYGAVAAGRAADLDGLLEAAARLAQGW